MHATPAPKVLTAAEREIHTRMEQQNMPPATPKDATKATEEQRELQSQLDDPTPDPEAPGGHQDRHEIADET
ncbi:hypothetical protein TUM20983_04440 [Mycobacterium antarcticum]|nr:hypothetical protein TUM20983_04440 [Mycolicibacterium sp. TUM20983]